ncbi:hypothetical protein [Sabulicella rubraurantiaca]|uniref:hypothetical protein n=1 Tax=Sabulicella rubraurantiaca TaxID=2811429 RepID=UPI001A976565|nr:hypothetical protein [Sabulicella rubraurantiaca]
MARRTLTAVFDNESDALRAQEALAAHGIPRSDVGLHQRSGSAARPEEEKGFLESLAELFLPDTDQHSYAEAVARGGTILSVRLADDRWEEAADILEANGAVDMDEREASWRSEGWSGRHDTARADYMSGLPEHMSTHAGATGTALDQPDGTPGNPPGTMLSRGIDEALGTNISGAYPENEMAAHHARAEDARLRGRDTATGTAARAAGVSGVAPHDPVATGDTARDMDRTFGTNLEGRPDGTPGNPPGTELSRGLDDALGTNMSGARPGNETYRRSSGDTAREVDETLGTNLEGRPDGTSGNPRGTMLSRGVDDALGTNISGARPENEAPRSSRRDATMERRRVRSYLWDEAVPPFDAGLESQMPRVSDDALTDRNYEASESREASEEARIARMQQARDEARNRM